MSTKIDFLIKSISLVLRIKIRKIEKGFHFEVVMEGEVGRVPTIVARWEQTGDRRERGGLDKNAKTGQCTENRHCRHGSDFHSIIE
jgi:hypothetical protein